MTGTLPPPPPVPRLNLYSQAASDSLPKIPSLKNCITDNRKNICLMPRMRSMPITPEHKLDSSMTGTLPPPPPVPRLNLYSQASSYSLPKIPSLKNCTNKKICLAPRMIAASPFCTHSQHSAHSHRR
eukprot:scaffold31170_cov69-Cyclotella_meneghiniana.AAC.11